MRGVETAHSEVRCEAAHATPARRVREEVDPVATAARARQLTCGAGFGSGAGVAAVGGGGDEASVLSGSRER